MYLIAFALLKCMIHITVSLFLDVKSLLFQIGWILNSCLCVWALLFIVQDQLSLIWCYDSLSWWLFGNLKLLLALCILIEEYLIRCRLITMGLRFGFIVFVNIYRIFPPWANSLMAALSAKALPFISMFWPKSMRLAIFRSFLNTVVLRFLYYFNNRDLLMFGPSALMAIHSVLAWLWWLRMVQSSYFGWRSFLRDIAASIVDPNFLK